MRVFTVPVPYTVLLPYEASYAVAPGSTYAVLPVKIVTSSGSCSVIVGDTASTVTYEPSVM